MNFKKHSLKRFIVAALVIGMGLAGNNACCMDTPVLLNAPTELTLTVDTKPSSIALGTLGLCGTLGLVSGLMTYCAEDSGSKMLTGITTGMLAGCAYNALVEYKNPEWFIRYDGNGQKVTYKNTPLAAYQVEMTYNHKNRTTRYNQAIAGACTAGFIGLASIGTLFLNAHILTPNSTVAKGAFCYSSCHRSYSTDRLVKHIK